MGTQAMGAMGASKLMTGDKIQRAVRDRLRTAPVTRAATMLRPIPAKTRSSVEVTQAATVGAFLPRPIRNSVSAISLKKIDGGGMTADSADPSWRPIASQASSNAVTDRKPTMA